MKVQLDMINKDAKTEIERNIQKRTVSDDQVPLLEESRENGESTKKQKQDLYRPRSSSSAKKTPEPQWTTCARMSVLGVTCYILLSAMMCDEVVAAAVPAIKESVDLDSSQVGLLYSSSFVPSLTFVLLGGFLQHKIGVRALSIGSTLLVVIGMVVFAMSRTFWGMIIGRILFGFGLGPTELVNDIIALRWYDSITVPSIEIAFGTIASFGMIGFILAFNLMPLFLELFSHMTDAESLRMAVLCLSIIPTITVAINVAYIVLDWWAAPALELDYADDDGEPSILETIKQLPFAYWLLFTINASCFAMMYVIMLYSVDFMGEKWGYNNLTAGQFSSAVYIAGIVISPLAGITIHKFGNMITLIFFGVVFFGAGCTIMGVTHLHPLVGLICIGTGLGMMETTLWTAVAEVVPEICFGPAFAFLSASVSIILVIVPFLAGWLHDHFDSYEPVAYVCAGSSVIGGICTIILYIVAPNLQKPSDKYKQYYIVKIVTRKKRSVYQRPRRHSITIGEVKQIVGYLTETDAFEDLHPIDEPVHQPKMFDLLYSDENERVHDTGSLPKDFFSKLVSHSATLVQVEEGHPKFEQAMDQTMLGGEANVSEMENDIVDLGKILQMKETTSSMKSRTVSEAPNVWMPEGTGAKKSRAVSDVSQTNWRKNTKLLAKMEKTKSSEKRNTFFPDLEFLNPLRSMKETSSKPVPISKEANVALEAEEEVWQPPTEPTLDNNLDRQRTRSDLTISNWGKYGRVQPPTAPSKNASGYFLGKKSSTALMTRTPPTDLGSYMNTPDGVESVDIPNIQVTKTQSIDYWRADKTGGKSFKGATPTEPKRTEKQVDTPTRGATPTEPKRTEKKVDTPTRGATPTEQKRTEKKVDTSTRGATPTEQKRTEKKVDTPTRGATPTEQKRTEKKVDTPTEQKRTEKQVDTPTEHKRTEKQGDTPTRGASSTEPKRTEEQVDTPTEHKRTEKQVDTPTEHKRTEKQVDTPTRGASPTTEQKRTEKQVDTSTEPERTEKVDTPTREASPTEQKRTEKQVDTPTEHLGTEKQVDTPTPGATPTENKSTGVGW